MQNHIDDLASVLAKQLLLYGHLLDLLSLEREALVLHKSDEVLALVRRKETLLLRIRTLEESRRLAVLRLAQGWGVKASCLTLTEIALRAQDCDLTRLSAVRAEMRQCLDKVQAANLRNSHLCRNGTEMIRRILEAASERTPGVAGRQQAAGYGPRPGSVGAARTYAAPPDPMRVRTQT